MEKDFDTFDFELSRITIFYNGYLEDVDYKLKYLKWLRLEIKCERERLHLYGDYKHKELNKLEYWVGFELEDLNKAILEKQRLIPDIDSDKDSVTVPIKVEERETQIRKSPQKLNNRSSSDEVEKFIWLNKKVFLISLFNVLINKNYIDDFEIEDLSHHFEINYNEEFLDKPLNPTSKGINWIKGKTMLIFMIDLLHFKGYLGIDSEKIHKFTTDHFLWKGNSMKDGKNSLGTLLNRANTEKYGKRKYGKYHKFSKDIKEALQEDIFDE